MNSTKAQRVVTGLAAREPEIGRWLWCLEEARGRTFQRLEGIGPSLVDWVAPEGGNSIGSILYHRKEMFAILYAQRRLV
jgi:hypothetical protein